MFRNYLAAALRNLVRNRLYAAINITGLAIGIATALLIAIFVRDELSFERRIPGYERVYLLQATTSSPENNQGPALSDVTDNRLAALLRLAFPAIEAITRLNSDEVAIRRGETESTEQIYWADQDTFKVLPLPTIAGDSKTALDRANCTQAKLVEGALSDKITAALSGKASRAAENTGKLVHIRHREGSRMTPHPVLRVGP